MTEELKAQIVWQDNKDFGKVCTLTESALDGIIAETTKELQQRLDFARGEVLRLNKNIEELQEEIKKTQHLADVRCNQAVENYQKWHVTNREKIDLKIKVEDLEKQIEKMKCCQNCDNWNWKHSKCEKKLKGDCFKASKWVMRNF